MPTKPRLATVRFLKPGESIPRDLYHAYLIAVPSATLRSVEQMADPVERGDPRAIGVGVFDGESMVGFSLGRTDRLSSPANFVDNPALSSSNYTTGVHTYIDPKYSGNAALTVLRRFQQKARENGSNLLIISNMNSKSEAFIKAVKKRAEAKGQTGVYHIVESPLLRTKNAYIRL